MRSRVVSPVLPETTHPARPFLKWAGGKSQLLPDLVARVAAAGTLQGYHEPFVGGGALFFELRRSGRLPSRVRLADGNPNLAEVYRAVRDEVDALITRLEAHRAAHCEAYYYDVRDTQPGEGVNRAARVIYLNKTCFNGLYRENSKGRFNVPIGSYTDPPICDAPNLRAASAALQGCAIETAGFEHVLDHARAGDFVYFDPPYVPVSKTASFTSYARAGFGDTEQAQLAEVVAELDRRGVKVLLSNSMTERVTELYARFRIETVMAARNVNRVASGRGKVAEALVRNFG